MTLGWETQVRQIAVLVVAAGAFLAAGCGDTGEAAGPADASRAPAEQLWDPCTEVGDDVLHQVGVDPASKRQEIAGVEFEGWKVCNWDNDDFSLSILSTHFTLDEIHGKEGNKDFAEIVVGGREGLQYRMESDSRDESCDIAFEAEQGAVVVATNNRVSARNVVEPCVRAESAGGLLAPILPE